jgi:antirestriction protein ArdC
MSDAHTPEGPKPPASPFRQMVAEELIKRLEEGTAPWQHYVKPGVLKDRPHNPASGTVYRGGNELWLSMQPYPDPRWMTYRQALEMGAQVKKGARGTKIEFWKTHDERIMRDEAGKPVLGEDGEPKKIRSFLERPIGKTFTVFNASQIDGLEPYISPELTFDPIERAEAVLAGADIRINHDTHSQAYYQGGSHDQVHLPRREHFKDAAAYYSTALHELGHATGHQSRLNRDMHGPFGSEKYAREELRAEISSLMVAQKLGIGHDPGNHAAYVKSWIQALRDDPNEIFRAARDADVIQTWLLEPEKRQELHQRHATTKALKTSEAKSMEQSEDKTQKKEEQAASRVYLNVPFKEKNEAKAAGAKWDRAAVKWYAPQGADMAALARWQQQPETAATKEAEQSESNIAQDRIYLAVPFGERQAAKEAGAFFDSAAKAWFAPKGTDLTGLAPWMTENRQSMPQVERSPVEAFAEELQANGFTLKGAPVMDGQWHRSAVVGDSQGKQSGSYRGFLDGLPNGQMINFKQGGETIQWTAASERATPEQLQEIAATAAATAATRKAEREQAEKAAAGTSFGIWKNAPAWGNQANSSYLREKGVEGYGVKVDKSGQLLVPLRDTDGRIHNLQVIRREADAGLGKIYIKGGRKTGLFHLIDPAKDFGSSPVIIVEGYATGAEVHAATKLPVVVAFDSGNLQPVAEAIKKAHPDVGVLIAGDNDHHLLLYTPPLKNTGVVKSHEAAQAVQGLSVVPTFTDAQKAKGLTDWNDLAKDQGKLAVRNALAPAVEALMKQHQALQHVKATQQKQQAQQAKPALAPAGLGLGLGFG